MADQLEVLSVAHRLHACGARLGASQVLFNALSQGQAAQAGDLAQSPAVGLGVKPQPHPAPANDHLPASEQPASPVA